MPPKRKLTTVPKDDEKESKKQKQDDVVVDNDPSTSKKEVKQAEKDKDEETKKEEKKEKKEEKKEEEGESDEEEKEKKKKKVKSVVEEDEEEEVVDKTKPKCPYGVVCYRKNPQHFKEFRHPKKDKSKDKKEDKKEDKHKAKAKKDEETDKDNDKGKQKNKDEEKKDNKDKDKEKDKDQNQDLENYKNVLRCALAKNTISVDEKRMLRTFRRNHNIDDKDHFRLILQFGWTDDEYDDGQRKDDDCDLEEERKVIKESGFAIISVKKAKNMPKDHDNVFSRVCAKFFQTMSKAQANYTVTEVGVIVNAEARKKFNLKVQEFATKGFPDLEWAFHGTTRESIEAIANTGFLHPDDLKKKAKKKKAKTTVTLLDDGFFGKGIYMSFYSDYAMFYSEERNSDQVLLSQVLPGKTFKCAGRMDGADCAKGYDSHYSPKGNEMVVFRPEQILPRYIITFSSQPDTEREPEV